mgnify:CR=1 FL=1
MKTTDVVYAMVSHQHRSSLAQTVSSDTAGPINFKEPHRQYQQPPQKKHEREGESLAGEQAEKEKSLEEATTYAEELSVKC